MHTDDDIFESLDIHSEGEPPAPSVPPVEAFDADEFLHPDLSDDDDIFEDLDMEDKIFSAGVSGSSGRAAGSASGAGASKAGASGVGASKPGGPKAGASKLSGRSVSDSRSGAAAGKAGGAAGKNGKGRSAASPREFNTVESSLDSRKLSREKAQKKKSRIRRIILWTVVEAITLCAIFVYGYVLRNWNLIARPEVKLEAIENHNISLDKKKEMEGFWNIAVFGVDVQDGYADAVMICKFDMARQRLDVASLPPDTLVNAAKDPRQLNALYADGGTEAMLAAVSEITGYTMDFYVTAEIDGFAALVDALGGVEFDIPMDMDYEDPSQGLEIHLTAGRQLLDGDAAQKLMRFRSGYAGWNPDRIEMQHAFLRTAVSQTISRV